MTKKLRVAAGACIPVTNWKGTWWIVDEELNIHSGPYYSKEYATANLPNTEKPKEHISYSLEAVLRKWGI